MVYKGDGAVKFRADQSHRGIQLRLVVVGAFGFFRCLGTQGLKVCFQQRQQGQALLYHGFQLERQASGTESFGRIPGVIVSLRHRLVDFQCGMIRAGNLNGDSVSIGKRLHRCLKMLDLCGEKISLTSNVISGKGSCAVSKVTIHQFGIPILVPHLQSLGMGRSHDQHISVRQSSWRVDIPIIVHPGHTVPFRPVNHESPGPPHGCRRSVGRVKPTNWPLIKKAEGIGNQKAQRQRQRPLKYLLSSIFLHSLTHLFFSKCAYRLNAAKEEHC